MVVADALPLIALAKMGRLGWLQETYQKVAIGPAVKEEVIEGGKMVGASEVWLVEKALQERWIFEVRLTGPERRLARQFGASLGPGEAECLALARSRHWIALLDDREARTLAESLDVEHVGTAGVLLEAFLQGSVNYGKLEEAVGELGRVIWLSPDVIAEILKRAREAGA